MRGNEVIVVPIRDKNKLQHNIDNYQAMKCNNDLLYTR
jgi:hypothetical protein